MSAVSYSGQAWSNMLDSRWNRLTIGFRSKVIATSGSVANIVGFRCRLMPDNVGSVIFETGVVKNLGVAYRIAYRIASLCLYIQKLCLHVCLTSAILKFACRSTCHVTNFTHVWVFSTEVLLVPLFGQRPCL